MQTQLPQIYYIIFTAITAGGVLLQAFVLLGMFLAIRQSTKKLHEVTDDFRAHVLPTVTAARRVIDDVAPKLKVATENLVEISYTLRDQTRHANATVDDVLNKTTAQAARVNEMTGAVLDSVEHAAKVLQSSVAGPYRQAASILAGLKVGLGVFIKKEKEPRPSQAEVAEEVVPGSR